MKTFFKKSIALALVLLILITSIPLMNFAGIDLRFTAQAATITSYSKGDIIEFGWYPQSKVTDSATITALNNNALAWENWTSYGYYSGTGSVGTMKQGDWMRYTDVIYDGNKYRGVKFTQYRKYLTWDDSPYTYQDDNGYSPNTVYWFKFEPIEWRVLDSAIGLVLCETIIDSQSYSNTIYSNGGGIYGYFNDLSYKNYASDYETSSIRKWLNTNFYNTAFSSSQQKIIKSTTLNNDSYYTSVGTTGYEKLDSNETKDKIFLLSYNEVRNNKFGFDSSSSVYDPARFAKGSDYAQSQGLYVCKNLGSPYNNNANWLLRSPGGSSDSCCCVFSYGNSNDYYSVYRTDLGVRPAMKLNLSAEIINPDNPNDPDEPVNPDNPVDPNNPDTPDSDDDPPISDSEVIIKFVKDTYEVYVGEKITVSGNVTCSSGINDLELEWENHYPEGVKVEKPGSQVTVSENELIFSTYIHGLKAGTYFVNLCDNNTTEFNSVKIVVLDYYSDDDEEEEGEVIPSPTKPTPSIRCNDATAEYKQNAFLDLDQRKEFTIKGKITNYDENHALTDISITIKSPDENKVMFKTDGDDKSSVTFPLKKKTIEVNKSRDFKCTAYINRDYNPPNGSEELTFTCILHGKLNGIEVDGIYSTFKVKIINLSYERPFDDDIDALAKEAAKKLDSISGAISIIKINADNPNLLTTAQLNAIGDMILCQVAMSVAPKDTYKDVLSESMIEGIFGVNLSNLTTGKEASTSVTVAVDSRKYGNLKIKFTCNFTSFRFNGSPFAYMGDVYYEIVGGKGVNMVKKKNGYAGGLTGVDMKAFSLAAYEVSLASLFNSKFGKKDENKILDIIFNKAVTNIIKFKHATVTGITWDIVSTTSYVVSIMCPVDVFVYDKNDKLVASIENNEITLCDESVEISVEDDKKYVRLLDENYRIDYRAFDEGTFQVVVEENGCYDKTLRTVVIEEIPINTGDTFTQTIDGKILEDSDYFILGQNKTYEHCSDTYIFHEHMSNGIWDVGEASTCTKSGWNWTNCSVCGDWFAKTAELAGHIFDAGSSKCSNCDYDKSVDCSCKCHKTGFIAKLIWKFKLFFQKLFKKNQVCSCGIYHY